MAHPLTAAAAIADLTQLLVGTSITSLTLSSPSEIITLHRSPASWPDPVVHPEPPGTTVSASCSGTFLNRHPLRNAPLVRVGQVIQAGTVLGLLRVGPLLLHIAAPQAGTVTAMTAEDTIVGYGTTLVEVA